LDSVNEICQYVLFFVIFYASITYFGFDKLQNVPENAKSIPTFELIFVLNHDMQSESDVYLASEICH